MGTQFGPNAGITGAVNLPGVGAKFQGRYYGYKQGLSLGEKPRLGRGSNNWQATRTLFASGTIAITGKVRPDAYPIPTPWKGQAGTITVQFDEGRTEDVPIIVTAADFSRDENEQDLFNVALTARVTANPTWSGWPDTQPATDDPTRSDQEQYQGTSKAVDPQGLTSGATRRTDVWGSLLDTDTAELQRLANIISAAQPPFAGMKLRSAVFSRDSLDGGEVLETWGLRDTVEDVVNPITAETLDPEKLGSQASAAAINVTPTTPGGDPLFVKRTETTNELVDGKVLHTAAYGRRSTREDVEFPGTRTGDDPYDLADDAVVTRVHDSATPPADPAVAPAGQLVERATTQLDRGKWQTVWTYRNLNSEQALGFPEATLQTDPSQLTDSDRQYVIAATSTAPAAPATRVAGLVLRRTNSRRVGGTPEKWLHIWEFGRTSTAEDVTFPGTTTTDEVSDIADDAVVTLLGTATPPAAPPAPVGQLLDRRSEQLTDAGVWKHIFHYGNTTALQREQFPTDHQDGDPSQLQDEDHQSDTTATSTPPTTPASRIAGLVLRGTSSVRIAGTPEKWLHRWTFGRRSTEQDITFPGTVTTDEVSDVADRALVTLVTSSPAPPATPLAPVGQLLEITSEQLTAAGRWKHAFRYGNTTELQKMQFPTDVLETDPSALRDEDHQSATTATSTAPAAPATRVTGLVLRVVTSKRISGTPEKWLHQWEFGRRSTAEDVTFPETVTAPDVSQLRDRATIALIGTSTPPTAPVAPLGQLVASESEQLTDAGKWKHKFTYANTTAIQEVQFGGTETGVDPSALEGEDKVTLTNGSSTPPAAPIPNPSTLKLRRRASQRIGGTPEQWRHTFVFGVRSTEDDVEQPNTFTTVDPSDLTGTGRETQVYDTGGSVPGANVPAALQQTASTIKFIHDGKKQIEYAYEKDTSRQKVEQARTRTVTDANNLASEASTAALDGTPASPGGSFVERDTLTEPVTHDHSVSQKRFGLRDTVDDVQMPESEVRNDATNLDHGGQQTLVYSTSGSAPGAPTVTLPTDAKVVYTSTQELNRLKSKKVFRLGVRTPKEEIEWLESRATDEPTSLEQAALVVKVTGSATPDASTDNPDSANLSYHHSVSHRLTNSQWAHAIEYRPLTPQEQLQEAGTVTSDDPAHILDERTRQIVDINASAPTAPLVSGMVCDSIDTQRVGKQKYRHKYHYSYRTSELRIEAEHAKTSTDPADLDSEQFVADVFTGSAPSDPPAPAGLKLVDRSDLTTPNPAYTLRVYRYGKLTSADRIINPQTVTVVDPQGMESRQSKALIDATPTLDAGYVSRGVKTTKLTDTHAVTAIEGGLRSTKDDVEMPGTSTRLDPSDLRSVGQQSSVYDTAGSVPAASVPSGLQKVGTETKQFNQNKSVVVYNFAKDTPKQETEQKNSFRVDDPGVLESTARQAALDATPSSPASPTGASWFTRSTRSELVTHDHTLNTIEYGLRSTVDDVTMPGSYADVDPLGLDSTSRITEVYPTSTPPSDPAPPAGLQTVSLRAQELNRATSQRVAEFAVLNTEQKRSFPKISTYDDPLNLEDEAVRAQFWTVGGTAPSTPTDAPTNNVKLVGMTDVPVSPTRNMRVWVYGPRSSADKLTVPHTSTDTDPNLLEGTAVRAGLDGDTITDPVGYVLRITRVVPVTLGLGVNRTLTVKEYGLRSTKDDVEMPGTFTALDNSVIESRGLETIVFLNGAATPLPHVPSGLQVTEAKTTKLNNQTSKIEYSYAINTNQQKLEFPETRQSVDPQSLESAGTAGGLNVVPGVPGGYVDRGYQSVRITPTQTLYVRRFGLRSTKDDIQFPKTFTDVDVSGLTTKGHQAVVFTTGTPPLTDPTPPAGTKIVVTRDTQLTADVGATPGLSVREYDYDVATPAERVELGATSANVTAAASYERSTATISSVLVSDTAAALADTAFTALKVDPLFDGVEVRKLTPQRALQIIKTANDDKLLRCTGSHTYEDAILGRPKLWGAAASYGSPDCVVHVTRLPGQPFAGPGGYTNGWVQPIKIWRHRGEYRYRRRYVTSDPASKILPALIGVTNNAALLGFDPHFLMFGPPIVHYSFAIAGAHLMLVDYLLTWDSQMWMNDLNLADGRIFTNNGVLLASPGYFDPVVAFSNLMTMAWPPDGNLSVITT